MSDSSGPTGFIAPLPTDLAPLFPGYEFQGLIATGGMGAVYRAIQKSLDRTVAIKILPLELSKDAAFCAGFEAEAKAMARLNHPNLIGVYDFGEVNGMLFIVMEFVAGESVYHASYGKALPPKEVIQLTIAICDGLAHAHENGIIHRDIKPSNILLDLNAQPKIGDFGLARPIDRKLEAGEEIFGTPHYTAPEVVSAPHTVDQRADIFSLGVMLHELLTGKLPANDARPASMIVRCDQRLDNIIRRATQPLPAARYSNATEMANDLRALVASKVSTGPKTAPIPKGRPSTPPRKYPRLRQKKKSNSSVILLLLVVVAAAAAYFFLIKDPPSAVTAPPPAPTRPVVIPKANPEKTSAAEPRQLPNTTSNSNSNPISENSGTDPATAPAPTNLEPINPASMEPKFDVPAFYSKAQKIMVERCKTLLFSHETSLKSNVDGLQRSLEKSIRKLDYDKTSAEEALQNQLRLWKTSKYLLPATPPESLTEYEGFEDLYNQAFQAQIELDEKLSSTLKPESETYILGLNKEIERRKADNDPGAVALIEKEIKATRGESAHFFSLMLGRSPSSAQPEESDDSIIETE